MHTALGKRLLSALVIVIGLVSATVWGPDWLIMTIFAVLTGVAMIEFYSFMDAAGIRSYRIFGTLCAVVMSVYVWISARYCLPDSWSVIPMSLLILGLIMRALCDKENDRILDTLGGTFTGIVYVGFLFSFLPRLWVDWWPREGRLLVMYMLLVVKWTDAGAYFIGCAIGKHKMIPRISPAKTWEGLAGGVVTAVAVSFIVFGICGGDLGVVRIEWYDALFLGVILSLAGVVGDLAESLLKRAAGKKDSGKIIRGMGGFLDVLDSPIFAAPVMYAYAKLFLDIMP